MSITFNPSSPPAIQFGIWRRKKREDGADTVSFIKELEKEPLFNAYVANQDAVDGALMATYTLDHDTNQTETGIQFLNTIEQTLKWPASLPEDDDNMKFAKWFILAFNTMMDDRFPNEDSPRTVGWVQALDAMEAAGLVELKTYDDPTLVGKQVRYDVTPLGKTLLKYPKRWQ